VGKGIVNIALQFSVILFLLAVLVLSSVYYSYVFTVDAYAAIAKEKHGYNMEQV